MLHTEESLQFQDIVKVQTGFSSSYGYFASSRSSQFHRICPRDNGTVVKPLIQAANYAAMDCATLERSELPLSFTEGSREGLHLSLINFSAPDRSQP
jgi:hypothetical protein